MYITSLYTYGFDMIVCKTDLILIQRLTNMCYIFIGDIFEAFPSSTTCLCSSHHVLIQELKLQECSYQHPFSSCRGTYHATVHTIASPWYQSDTILVACSLYNIGMLRFHYDNDNEYENEILVC